MFKLYDPDVHQVPILAWLEDESQLDDTCRRQAENLAKLPLAFRHVALMPDTHGGFGMPIGGVLACENAIIPNAVGVDIGCGVHFVRTDMPAEVLDDVETPQGSLAHAIVADIMRDVPTGFSHHKRKQACQPLDRAKANLQSKKGLPDLEEGYYQVGTLGGGNHFIELQEDQEGCLCLMVHSGSRNFGFKTARFFNQRAKEMAPKLDPLPADVDLAYLPPESPQGRQYQEWLQLCLEFALENRARIMHAVRSRAFAALQRWAGRKPRETLEVQAHHNYAAREEHFGRRVWVHRKGAIEAREGQWGIVPGAMGSYSYITKGLGHADSFRSSSHGAGRVMGRKEAVRSFSVEEVVRDLKTRGVVLGKTKKKDTAEEYRLAYKDIDEVMALQKDLTQPVLKLKTKAVVKG